MPTIEVRIPDDVSADAAQEAVTLLARHHDLLRRISDTLAEQTAPAAPAIVAQLARAEELWRTAEARYGLLDADQVARLTGGNPAKARAHTANLRRRKGLLAVTRHGRLAYPGFQFTPEGGLRPGWREITRVFTEAGWTPEEITLWAVAPTGWLDGQVPADLYDADTDAVMAAARTVAAGTAT